MIFRVESLTIRIGNTIFISVFTVYVHILRYAVLFNLAGKVISENALCLEPYYILFLEKKKRKMRKKHEKRYPPRRFYSYKKKKKNYIAWHANNATICLS